MMTASLSNIAAPIAPPRRLPFSFAKRQDPLFLCPEEQYRLACQLQVEPAATTEAQRLAGRRLPFKALDEDAFNQTLAASYQHDSSAAMQLAEDLSGSLDLTAPADQVPETEDLMEQEDDVLVIRLINVILGEVIRESVSDIHLETFEKYLVVRFCVDGVLREVLEPKRRLMALLISRVKVMARPDIAEKCIPQGGRISPRVGGREVDIRALTLLSANGERVVLRLPDRQAGRLNLQHLGMSECNRKLMDKMVRKPHGILLVTGPTGSGKTTTLYASLTIPNNRTRNILTVGDSIEYHLKGIGQTQVNAKVDMTFARGLRVILRQDPDVVMVGEIRDREIIEIVVQASLTGYLVLSTLHTNSATGAIIRLVDMGIEPFPLSSSMFGVLAQRLARVLCPACKESYHVDEAEYVLLGVDPVTLPTLHRARGCGEYHQHGYRGRAGIYEPVVFDDHMRSPTRNESSEQEVTRHARTSGPSICDDGRRKVLEDVTTAEEVLCVTREE